MSDDEADPELLELLRKSLGISEPSHAISADTKVLRHAEFVYANSIDVAIDMRGSVAAAAMISKQMKQRAYSTEAWSEHDLHPKTKDESTVNFIFTMDLLNFSFWSELGEDERFSVDYRGKRWTGYWSLVACLQRALDEGIPITSPSFWLPPESAAIPAEVNLDGLGNLHVQDATEHETIEHNAIEDGPEDLQSTVVDSIASELPLTELADHTGGDANFSAAQHIDIRDVDMQDSESRNTKERLSEEKLGYIFRSTTSEGIPLFAERLACLREAGKVLLEHFDGSVINLIHAANGSAGMLVNLLAHHFSCFRDEAVFDRRRVQIMKRAQILVADLWAAFNGRSFGAFDDINKITMFADYRVPQILHSLGCLSYSPPLDYAIKNRKEIPPGHPWEVQLRGCSIWCVESIRRQMIKTNPDAKVNAILIDFFLYDLAKERELAGQESIPHHRTRSIWY